MIIEHFFSLRQTTGVVRDQRVLSSRGWKIGARPLVRPPTQYSSRKHVDLRYDACRGSTGTTPFTVDTDVAFAVDATESRWAAQLEAAIADEDWCSQRNVFDHQLLFGRPPPGFSENCIRRNDADRRRERHARCSSGRFISSHEVLH